ncbi:MAG: outer membrane lipoprotein carrier protein LolA [Myxococcales bacterium]|nr:outer membrane lipoprotein carrier protein LolA [Myxococcales bacterium]
MRCCNAWFSGMVIAGMLLAGAAEAQAPVAAPAATAAAPTLETILTRFAAMTGLSARFREEKRMALLAAPLVNEGTLYFAPKARLARHITAPAPATVLIDEGSLRYADAGGSEALQLDANPVLRLFVDSFVKIFAGDRAALDRMYTMELAILPAGADGVPRWSLKLRPRIAPMTQVIDRLELVGRDVVLETMTVVEVGGDETITTFSEVDANRRFTPEESSRLFSLPPRPAAGPR